MGTETTRMTAQKRCWIAMHSPFWGIAGVSDLMVESGAESTSEIHSKGVESKSRLKVGFLTYDLQRNTEDALFEVAQAAPFSVKAFPLYAHPDQEHSQSCISPGHRARKTSRSQRQGQHT